MATESQAKWLRKFGYDPNDYDVQEASEILEREFKNQNEKEGRGGGNRGGNGRSRGGDRDSNRGRDSGSRGGRGRGGGGGMQNPDGPVTDKQAEILEDFNYNPDDFTKAQAKELIGMIADNNWKDPTEGAGLKKTSQRREEPRRERQETRRDSRRETRREEDDYGAGGYDPERDFYDEPDDDIPF